MIEYNTKVSFRRAYLQETNPIISIVNSIFLKSEIIGISECNKIIEDDPFVFVNIHLRSGETVLVYEDYHDLVEWFKTI